MTFVLKLRKVNLIQAKQLEPELAQHVCLSPSTPKPDEKPGMVYLFVYRTIRVAW